MYIHFLALFGFFPYEKVIEDLMPASAATAPAAAAKAAASLVAAAATAAAVIPDVASVSISAVFFVWAGACRTATSASLLVSASAAAAWWPAGSAAVRGLVQRSLVSASL